MSEDQFEQYYTEKLWEAIPAIYRHEDGLAEKPGVLRAIVQVIAKQAAILRRSQDSLWDDQFIEFCNEWAVPYIGDLLATRLLSEKNKRGRRIDVAKTIYYRRRKGTPRVLEELINDISGWQGKLVEQFQKLSRARHGLDVKPETQAGKYTGTLPGGWADLRNQRASELTNGPFEEFSHTPDMRQHHGLHGRYAITKLAFYLYRLKAFEAIEITPFPFGDGIRFSFDPSGRDIPLFSKSTGLTDWNKWHALNEPDLPAPIPCRLLGHEVYLITEAIIVQLTKAPTSLTNNAASHLRKIAGLYFKSEASLRRIISSFPVSVQTQILNPSIFLPLLSFSLVEDCGKSVLLPDTQSLLNNFSDTNSILVESKGSTNLVFTTELISAANLKFWPIAMSKKLAIDAEKGRFMLQNPIGTGENIFVSYHYGFSGSIGAGTYERIWLQNSIPTVHKIGGGPITPVNLLPGGITQIDDSKTYSPVPSKTNITNMVLQAASMQRPYLQLKSNWRLDSGANTKSSLTLDGLWIGCEANTLRSIIVKGDFKCVVIRNCSIDPGGSHNILNQNIHPVILIIEGKVENLCIESSILGTIMIRANGKVEEMTISDSIIQAVIPGMNAISLKTGTTHIDRSTVFGNVVVHRLESSESLFTGFVNVLDTQNGCFRFSAAKSISRLPHPYESFLFSNNTKHWFTSRRFGDPGYAQLSDAAPIALARGAENGCEMGAFNTLFNAIKFDGLKSKIDEYMPFGLIPIFINKT